MHMHTALMLHFSIGKPAKNTVNHTILLVCMNSMHLQQSVQLEEHEMELIEVGLKHVAMMVLVHDFYQHCKRLFLGHFL